MTLVWSEARFATGIAEIDAQHRELFDVANTLLEAAGQGRPRDEVGEILDALHDHAVAHFTCEEAVMARRKCSSCVANKQAHAWFLSDFTGLRDTFDRTGVTPRFIEEVEEKVCVWLSTHLLAIDTALRRTVATDSAHISATNGP